MQKDLEDDNVDERGLEDSRLHDPPAAAKPPLPPKSKTPPKPAAKSKMKEKAVPVTAAKNETKRLSSEEELASGISSPSETPSTPTEESDTSESESDYSSSSDDILIEINNDGERSRLLTPLDYEAESFVVTPPGS